ncbi:helix-turn-helix transcriptional regulator, partial [Salmonella enterica subsp. enterica serovar Javiana]|nr:helix-turn-helix transcriptional regulator [Salmonella enterica subsp. enterica serovar Javiana]
MENTVIKFILNWVEKNIYTGENIGDLVGKTGYSRKTLETWFYKYSNITLGDYLLRRRMSRIAVLLRMTELSVSELSAMFHFYSSQNLSRAFKYFSGVTPTSYRKQEGWLTGVLQRPLLMGVDNGLIPERCFLTELTLNGVPEIYTHNFLLPSAGDAMHSKMQESLRQYRENNESEICFACRTIPSLSIAEGRSYIVNVEMIIQSNHRSCRDSDSVSISSGEYMKFDFRGQWDEYVVFTRLIYFKLVEENIHRREGFDLSFF